MNLRAIFVSLLAVFILLNFSSANATETKSEKLNCENYKKTFGNNVEFKICQEAEAQGVSYDEMHTAALLATRKLVTEYCPDIKLTQKEQEFHDSVLSNERMKKLYDSHYQYIYHITLYSVTNWCIDYGGKMMVFIL